MVMMRGNSLQQSRNSLICGFVLAMLNRIKPVTLLTGFKPRVALMLALYGTNGRYERICASAAQQRKISDISYISH